MCGAATSMSRCSARSVSSDAPSGIPESLRVCGSRYSRLGRPATPPARSAKTRGGATTQTHSRTI
eukprot:1989610-Pyramimonas_sp.AAC.1